MDWNGQTSFHLKIVFRKNVLACGISAYWWITLLENHSYLEQHILDWQRKKRWKKKKEAPASWLKTDLAPIKYYKLTETNGSFSWQSEYHCNWNLISGIKMYLFDSNFNCYFLSNLSKTVMACYSWLTVAHLQHETCLAVLTVNTV